MSVVLMLLSKESFSIHSQLLPNPLLKYVMRQHRICNRVDSISLKSNLLPLLGKPGTWDIPVGKLPSEGDFLQLLHGEIEARGGTVSSREVKDLCCGIKEDKCQCEGGKGTEVESGEALGMDKVHCLARGQPCLIPKI